MTAGQRLRKARENQKLSLRDVEKASEQIANKHASEEYLLSASRISDFETKDIVPHIHKLYSFAAIYDLDYLELLRWYGVDLTEARKDAQLAPNLATHQSQASLGQSLSVPIRLDGGFDPSKTLNVARFIQEWGVVPLAYLQELAGRQFTYIHVGINDRTMYPLILPGSFLQVDESMGYVTGRWRSEYERPIYLVETREGLMCCWCELQGGKIVLQPHPLSQVPVRILSYPQEAEILGTVVGIAMSLSLSGNDP